MKIISDDEKINKVKSVIMSCKDIEQLMYVRQWIMKLNFIDSTSIIYSYHVQHYLYGITNEMQTYLESRVSK